MRKALALVNVAPNRIELEELEVPNPSPDDVVVLTRHSMISNGTERSVLAGERKYGLDVSPFPQVGGYQKVGIAESVGRNVAGIAEGDWVFACMGRTNLPGYASAGHIAISVTPKEQVLKLPKGLDPVAASGLVLTQVGFNHGSRPPVSEGTRAIVFGDGLVGLWSAETLQGRGVAVLLIGRHEERLGVFEPKGGSRVINARQTDPNKRPRNSRPAERRS
jgi:threonine dehydrogenase-like Zn-dependent dehydrogenase